MSLAIREMLQDRYEVVRNIKSGGMGSVYEAVDHKLASTPCAIKEVLASALEGGDSTYVLQSFESEMRALAGLEHPNIPRVRDYFEVEGRRYIVLDLVQGQALDDELSEHLRLTHEPMDPAVAAVDMVQVLETLTYLHNCRPPIIHRDIKSANLIRDSRSGRIKLVDFGIARSVETQRVQTQVGTPGFCAPEQMGGRAEVRSDLYSVGATLYHLCTGRLPPAFTFDSLEMDLPRHPGLVKIVLKATQPKPQDRYATAEEMAQALRAWLRNEGSTKIDPKTIPPATQTKINPLAVTPTPPNSQNGLWVAVAAMLLAALGLLYNDYASRFSNQEKEPSPPLRLPLKTTPTPAAEPPLAQIRTSSTSESHPTPVFVERESQPRPKPAPRPKARPEPAPIQPQPKMTPSLGDSVRYPTRHEQATYHSSAPLASAADPAPNPDPPPASQRCYGRSLEQMPDRLGQLTRISRPGDRYFQQYQGQMGDYAVNLGIMSCRQYSYEELTQRSLRELGPFQENRANEGPREYCGFRIDGNQHIGLHVKDGLAYRITVTPPPPASSAIWPQLMDVIRHYP
jgi:serine/threonine protein kinase